MLKRRGQSAMELIVLITIVMAVFLTVGNYFKRGVQGRWKAAVDDLGDQYDPRATNSDLTHTLSTNTETRITTIEDGGNAGIWTMRYDTTETKETKSGTVKVGAY